MNFNCMIFFPILLGLHAHKVRYDGYQVFRIVPRNLQQLQRLHDLQVQNDSYNFWGTFKLNQFVDVMVPPNKVVDFKSTLDSLSFNTSTIIKNIQEQINKELVPKSQEKFDWKNYHPLNKIYDWLRSLAIKYPNVVTLLQGGRSYEGRSITGVKISYKRKNKAVFVEGGIHAREWISPATATYIINQLIMSNDSNVRYIAEARDWYIFPVINPDGYEYSMRTDRMWRKNRRPITVNCTGVDLNRNWGYKWMHGGGSSHPCSSYYTGNRPFSEMETKSLSDFIETISSTLEGFITFHSYSQQLLIPFGNDGLEVPANNNQLLRIGKIAVEALSKRYGTQYRVGNIFDTVGIASGSIDDWVLGTHRHIKFVYTYELRDKGECGFFLPASEIIPTCEETLDSIVSIIIQFQNDEDAVATVA